MDIAQARSQTSFVIQIGTDKFPVNGNARDGWNVAATGEGVVHSCWYESLDELIFVLINFSVAGDATA